MRPWRDIFSAETFADMISDNDYRHESAAKQVLFHSRVHGTVTPVMTAMAIKGFQHIEVVVHPHGEGPGVPIAHARH